MKSIDPFNIEANSIDYDTKMILQNEVCFENMKYLFDLMDFRFYLWGILNYCCCI